MMVLYAQCVNHIRNHLQMGNKAVIGRNSKVTITIEHGFHIYEVYCCAYKNGKLISSLFFAKRKEEGKRLYKVAYPGSPLNEWVIGVSNRQFSNWIKEVS
jgi:hypothetical protein